jgi:hypothetical protein
VQGNLRGTCQRLTAHRGDPSPQLQHSLIEEIRQLKSHLEDLILSHVSTAQQQLVISAIESSLRPLELCLSTDPSHRPAAHQVHASMLVKVLGDPRQPLTGRADSLFVTDCKAHTELKYDADHMRDVEADPALSFEVLLLFALSLSLGV